MLKVFFADYCEGKILPSESARVASKAEILRMAGCVLHTPSNFLGITDENGATIQFIVNEDTTIAVDVPDLNAGGSHVKMVTLDECLQIVRDLDESVEIGTIPGLKFEAW